LDPLVQERYEAEAQALGLPLSTYLRQRLEKSDAVLAELWALRQAVEAIGSPPAAAKPSREAGDKTALGLQVETVLLLRALMLATSRTQDVKMVHADLGRLGLPLWKGKQ